MSNTGDGSVTIVVTLDAGAVLLVKPFKDLPTVPLGWHATLTLQGDGADLLANTSDVSDSEWPEHTLPSTLQIDACDHPRPLQLYVHSNPPITAKMQLSVDLQLAHCQR